MEMSKSPCWLGNSFFDISRKKMVFNLTCVFSHISYTINARLHCAAARLCSGVLFFDNDEGGMLAGETQVHLWRPPSGFRVTRARARLRDGPCIVEIPKSPCWRGNSFFDITRKNRIFNLTCVFYISVIRPTHETRARRTARARGAAARLCSGGQYCDSEEVGILAWKLK